jgi:hypothetical protein
MKKVSSISDLPNCPAVYAMYGQGRGLYVAFVGIAGRLKAKIRQHLVRRDSSVVTGTSAVALNPDLVVQINWWEHPRFTKRPALQAAEAVAFELLEPALRSRGGTTERAKKLLSSDKSFRKEMRSLFLGPPAGRLVLPTLEDALERIGKLEQRVKALEEQLDDIRTADGGESALPADQQHGLILD